jgi:uncharacterized membrane protein
MLALDAVRSLVAYTLAHTLKLGAVRSLVAHALAQTLALGAVRSLVAHTLAHTLMLGAVRSFVANTLAHTHALAHSSRRPRRRGRALLMSQALAAARSSRRVLIETLGGSTLAMK